MKMQTRRCLALAAAIVLAFAVVAGVWHSHVAPGQESVRVPSPAKWRGPSGCAACILSSQPASWPERTDTLAPMARPAPLPPPESECLPCEEFHPRPSPRGPPSSPSIDT